MDYAVNKGTTSIGYSGESNGVYAYKIVEDAVKYSNGNATYISKLPAGELLGSNLSCGRDRKLF